MFQNTFARTACQLFGLGLLCIVVLFYCGCATEVGVKSNDLTTGTNSVSNQENDEEQGTGSHNLPPIDPTLVTSSFFGGTGTDRVQGCTQDTHGFIYVVGNTASKNVFHPAFTNAPCPANGSAQDAFVAKLSANGEQILWARFLCGDARDQAYGAKIAANGDVVVVGVTASNDFVTTQNAYDRTFNGGSYGDIFVTRVKADGSDEVYSTYIGGNASDKSRGVLYLDPVTEEVTIVGSSKSTDFPVFGIQNWVGFLDTQGNSVNGNQLHGSEDAVVLRLAADGSNLVFSSYLGGNDIERGYGIGMTSDNKIVAAGFTRSINFPVSSNALQKQYGGDEGSLSRGDVFISRLSYASQTLTLDYSTYYGGSSNDGLSGNNGLVVQNNEITLIGETDSTDLPGTSSGAQPGLAAIGQVDGFVATISDSGNLKAATYFGGTAEEETSGLAVDDDGRVIFSGNTASTDYPVTTSSAFQTTYGGGVRDAWLTILSPDLNTTLYSTFVGGAGVSNLGERGRCVSVFNTDKIIVTGDTDSQTTFPVVGNAIQPNFGGNSTDGFLTVFSY